VARTLPVYAVEVAWTRAQTGVAVVGTATVGGAGVVAGAFSNFTFAAVTADVQSVEITRGRTDDQSQMAAGRCRIVLTDTTGKYNPQNAGSPLAPDVLPMRPIRVRATHNSLTYGLFFGWITRLEHDPSRTAKTTVIEAEDVFGWLSRLRPSIALGQTTVGAAVGALLDACNMTDPAFRSLDAGHGVPFVVSDSSTDTSALQVIQNLLAADMGVFFVDGAGVATYRSAATRYAPGAVDDTLTAALIGDARPSADAERVRNGFTVQRAGGVPQQAFDPVGRDYTAYGPRDAPPLTTPYLWDDETAANLAAFKVLLYKDPEAPARRVRLANRDDALIVKQLTRDLGDRVTVTETLGGTSFTGFVEGVRHRIWGAGRFHEAEFTVVERRFDFATVGSSAVGSAHVVGY
jgi:hypothetical protein